MVSIFLSGPSYSFLKKLFNWKIIALHYCAGGGGLFAKSCLTLCGPMGCSLPSSSVHGIFQARILEWVAISFSRGSSWPRDRTCVSFISSRLFTDWATRGKPHNIVLVSAIHWHESAIGIHFDGGDLDQFIVFLVHQDKGPKHCSIVEWMFCVINYQPSVFIM